MHDITRLKCTVYQNLICRQRRAVLMNTCGTHINTLYAPLVRQYVHACVPYSLEHPNRIGCRAIMQSGIRCVWLLLIVIMRRTIAMLSMLPVNHNEDYIVMRIQHTVPNRST